MELRANIAEMRSALADLVIGPAQIAEAALACANANSTRNTYLWRDPKWTKNEAARVAAMPSGKGGRFGDGRANLWGIPVSVKDLFDLAGTPTSCGVEFYRAANSIAENDSWLVEQLRNSGAVITGKTHLHPLAFGITGENPDFGDCEQPGNPGFLTGGSSSGAAASILEGSALAAIGTDTGGSIRLPAAVCGLVGYRASIGRGDWRGGAHLSQTFDTMGCLFRDLEDAPLLAQTFVPPHIPPIREYTSFAVVHDEFLHDCEPAIVESLRALTEELHSLGLKSTTVAVPQWQHAFEIYAAIQAREAAAIRAGSFQQFPATTREQLKLAALISLPSAIRERLEWGAKIADSELAIRREQLAEFRAGLDALLNEHQLLLLPASPVAQLAAGADHSHARKQILRYTTPFSLGGNPVLTIPCPAGGMQLAAAHDEDESLLELGARLGSRRAAPE